MGNGGRASVSGDGGMPGRDGGTETDPPSAGASLRPHVAGSRCRGWMRGKGVCVCVCGGGVTNTTPHAVRSLEVTSRQKHILNTVVRRKINM